MAYEDPEDDRTFFERHRLLVVGVVLLVGAGLVGVWFKSASKSGRHTKQEKITMVDIMPPPPPPRPTPVPTPPPPREEPPPPEDQKMIEQAPLTESEKNEEPEEAPADDPAPALGTGIVGNGPADGFGLGRSGNGFGGGRRGGTGGSKWGRYAGMVQNQIAEAMRKHSRTRTASLRVEVRIWPDSTGRISRAELVGSTGDRSMDEILRKEILTGLRLPQAPPPGMPTPIVLRLTAQKSG